MRAVVQRVSSAAVKIEGQEVSRIGNGCLILLGISAVDTQPEAKKLADKLVNLRVFEDSGRKMNLSLLDVAGEALVVSQFTLYADVRKGRRPSFVDAAPPAVAEVLYNDFVAALRSHDVPVATGVFGAMMQVSLINHGPVTLILDTNSLF